MKKIKLIMLCMAMSVGAKTQKVYKVYIKEDGK